MPAGDIKTCDMCGKKFKPQGFAVHTRMHERRGADVIPKRTGARRPASETAARRAVSLYLKALKENKGPKKAKLNATELAERIIAAEEAGQYVKALKLTQQRYELEVANSTAHLEVDFIKYAQEFSETHGIGVPAWEEMGVPSKVLRAAGIK